MKITSIDCHVLVAHDLRRDAASSAQDDFIVEVRTDEGITGFGEADLNPWIGRACVEAPSTHNMGLSLRDMLVGEDPLDPCRLWTKLYQGSAMNGRRGAMIHAIGALDIALWDIVGKSENKPLWQLLADKARSDNVVPYASLEPRVEGISNYQAAIVDWAVRAKEEFGFRAAKLEITFGGPYAHLGTHGTDKQLVDVVRAVREAVGPQMTLMIDVQYTWADAKTAVETMRALREYDVYFVEAPLWPDDLEGYATIHSAQTGTRTAVGEWLATRYEFVDFMDRGQVEVVQPDIGRVGGFTEALRVGELARVRSRIVVPHAWKSGLSIAAELHFATVTPNCKYVEFLPRELTDSELRRAVTTEDLQVRNGELSAPNAPGLGLEVNRDALAFFRAE